MQRRTKGFTILELLVVIAIIAILAAIAIPSFIGKIDKVKDSADIAEINAVQKAISLYYLDNGSYPTLQGLDASLGQVQPVDGSPQNVDFSKLVPNYLAKLPHFSYWWLDYKGNVYHTEKSIGNVTGSVFTPQTGYTYTLYKGDGSTQVLSAPYTFQAGEYVLGKDDKGRELPKISGVFKNEKLHPESPEYVGVGKETSGDPATMLTASQWLTFDWSSVKAPTGQTSGNIGVDSWGNPVNMDLWKVSKQGGTSICLNSSLSATTSAYKGTFIGGQIEGYVPAKVKMSGDTSYVDVTNMYRTFQGCTGLTSAPVIPKGVTDMTYTFYGCTNLTTAPVIPNGVTNMSCTFYGCSGLTSAPVLPSSVTNMSQTFSGCSSLTSAPVIPSSVTNMYGTFQRCTGLTSAPVIPNDVTNMSYTFYECSGLTSAPIIPSSLTTMSYTFKGCTGLTSAPVIPSSVTSMTNTFNGCTGLTSAPVIPSGVTTMISTFAGCTGLTSAPVIPSGVTDMTQTFYGCTGLTSAPVLPSSVTSMSNTFKGCTNLTTAPVIPSSVAIMTETFNGCVNLSGSIDINAHANAVNASGCFTGAATQSTLTLNYSTASNNGALIDYFITNKGASLLVKGVAK